MTEDLARLEQRVATLEKRISEYQRCGFCGKNAQQVRTILVGPGASICNECISHCLTTIGKAMMASYQAEAPKANTPIFEEDGKWWFWDETTDRRGPYDSREDAESKLAEYCAHLNGEPERPPMTPFQTWLDGCCVKHLDCNLSALTGATSTVAGSTVKTLLDLVEQFFTVPNANGDLITSSTANARLGGE